MKFRWDKKYLHWGITAFLVIAASVCFYSLLFHGSNIRQGFKTFIAIAMPIIDGLILAYLLSPVLNAIERKLLYPLCEKLHLEINSQRRRGVFRTVSVVLTMLLVFIFLKSFFSMVIPQIIKSIQSIVLQFPSYVNTVSIWVEKMFEDNPDMETVVINLLDTYSAEINQWLNTTLLPQMNELLKTVSLSLISVVKALWNLIIGFVISIYVLMSKEKFAGQSKKIIYAFLDIKTANTLIHDLRFTHRTFSGFISGKILDSIIIGILCFFVTNIMKTPYAVLISVIIGITNIIPFFGPYLGAIPSAFLILMVDPLKCLYFVIFILILQQFDGNILGPKILGDSTGLTGFWVIFAITLFGGFFGILGMFIGVPVFAVIYAIFKANIERLLLSKGLPTMTDPYLKVGYINEDEFIDYTPEKKSTKSSFVLFDKKKRTENGQDSLVEGTSGDCRNCKYKNKEDS